MKSLEFMNSTSLFIEISHSSLRVVNGAAGLELPIKRLPDGKLTQASREQSVAALKTFVKRPAWRPTVRAWCAIGARGVLLRRLTIPPAGKNEFHQMLRLQIESEFPLSPDALAWGYLRLDDAGGASVDKRQELIVAAVKKEVVLEYDALLAECGINATFTLAALARSSLCPSPTKSYALLEIGRDHSEFLSFDNGIPAALRILPWGEGNLASTDSLKTSIKTHWPIRGIGGVPTVFLLGNTALQKEIASRLAKEFAEDVKCEQVSFSPGEGQSAAILGLKKSLENEADRRILVLHVNESKNPTHAKGLLVFTDAALRKWALLAGLLLIGCLVFPYMEALLLKPFLLKKIAAAKASRGTLDTIDRELSFLQHLKQNQSPYLDAMYLIANAAPGGTRFDSISMDRRGEISLRGSLRDLQQVVLFRSKIIESGFFSNVTVEEQTPTPDRQKVNVRMTAQWKPANARQSLKIGPTPEEMEKIKAAAKEGGAGGAGFPMMGSPFPMGMPEMSGMGGTPPSAAPKRVPPRVVMPTNMPALPPGFQIVQPVIGASKE